MPVNSETDTTCLHEGKFRQEETSGEQVLSFLTLENRLAYEIPDAAPRNRCGQAWQHLADRRAAGRSFLWRRGLQQCPIRRCAGEGIS